MDPSESSSQLINSSEDNNNSSNNNNNNNNLTNMEVSTVAPIAVNLTFQLLTHNMWVHYLTSSPNKVQRMHIFMNEVAKHNYDVVFLQEIFIFNIFGMAAGAELRQYMEVEFKKLGYEHQALGDNAPWVWGQTSGLCIFSKHPISTSKERRWYKPSDWGTGKGYIHAVINIHNEDIHFINVHLDAHGAPARREQVKAIVNDLPKPYDTCRVVIAGDYNIHYNSTEYIQMMEDMTPREIHDIDDEPVATHQNGATIDHILISNNMKTPEKHIVKYTDNNGVAVSDHYGVAATIQL